MEIVFMAGGRGTRIASVNSEIPKPMLPILGKPVLEYGIECIRNQGYTDITIVIGYLGHIIKNYFGDGFNWGVSIQYIEEKVPLGTAGALYYMRDRLSDDFLLINGDIIFDIDIKRMHCYHNMHKGIATILTHPNDHPYDSGIIIADQDGCVQDWLHKESERLWYQNRVNAGIHILSPQIFDKTYSLYHSLKKMDLDRDVLKPLISKKKLFAYNSSEYVKDMGTPDRLIQVSKDIQSGKVEAKNLRKKQRAVFLDRDGTINKYVGFLKDIDDFELLPGVGEAIRNMNALGYLVIVISNQPVIARGEVSEKELSKIHNKMETLLGKKGAYIDAIYYCPHHPDKGYVGERVELKIDCNCRKPKPGMILQAAKDFNIDLSKSWMVGDSETDVVSGERAGCKTVYLGNQEKKYGQLYTFESLQEVCSIL
ncbi:MAG: HAD-IIIA family hydrolase [Lachnospiraceae bacterium]